MPESGPWQVVDELIEQPSWGGHYIIDLKGLSDNEGWLGKKVGQSYELANTSLLVNPKSGEVKSFTTLISSDPEGWLGDPVIAKFGTAISLLIKLTQAKGNSFQVHLPEGKTLNHWRPKPEAWFYLAPGLFTFGLRRGTSFERFSDVLLDIDRYVHDLSGKVKSAELAVDDARVLASEHIAKLNPSSYINTVHAKADDIVDLTAGGIHHSWEEDKELYPEGNLVYEVQVDVQDEFCSMRGFDKGKILDNGSLRPSHVADYLATIEQDSYHNELSNHIRKPELIRSGVGVTEESLFRTPYFNLDRITLEDGGISDSSTVDGFHHLFVLAGDATIGAALIEQGKSYLLPAATGSYAISALTSNVVVLKTYLPV